MTTRLDIGYNHRFIKVYTKFMVAIEENALSDSSEKIGIDSRTHNLPV